MTADFRPLTLAQLSEIEEMLPSSDGLHSSVAPERANEAIELLMRGALVALGDSAAKDTFDYFHLGYLMLRLEGRNSDGCREFLWRGSLGAWQADYEFFQELLIAVRLLNQASLSARYSRAGKSGGSADRNNEVKEAFLDWFSLNSHEYRSKNEMIEHALETWDDWCSEEGLEVPQKRPGKRTLQHWLEGKPFIN